MALDILIIDDEDDIRDLIAGILEDEGFEARQAHDADSGSLCHARMSRTQSRKRKQCTSTHESDVTLRCASTGPAD